MSRCTCTVPGLICLGRLATRCLGSRDECRSNLPGQTVVKSRSARAVARLNLYHHHQTIIQEMSSRGGKLAPEVNRALFVKNLSYNVTPEELFDLFGKFGPIRQVRQGIANNTKGTAFVVYEDVADAKQACDKLNGFNFQNRYLVVLYHQPDKMAKSKEDLEARRESLAQLKQQHGID
ncbi:hypothetical protein FOXB_10660 [Fusarium oxysporum f. sp. conglutinans Fo5176]|uniref:RRM domain-containing protein n=42 Tax=Fusarium TaxID=5506 RepID=F9FW78_FUSOF|nr:hypothetical protein FOXB_10660 [Fusarium oxysporum f. sp. conglutinans Fo5176]